MTTRLAYRKLRHRLHLIRRRTAYRIADWLGKHHSCGCLHLPGVCHVYCTDHFLERLEKP